MGRTTCTEVCQRAFQAKGLDALDACSPLITSKSIGEYFELKSRFRSDGLRPKYRRPCTLPTCVGKSPARCVLQISLGQEWKAA